MTAGVPGANGVVNIAAGGAMSDTVAGPSLQVSLTFENDGDIVGTSSATGSADLGDWITPKGAAPGSYQIMAHQESGDAVSGTLDTWLALTSSRTWALPEQIGAGSKSATLTVSIRLGGVVLSSGTFALDETVL